MIRRALWLLAALLLLAPSAWPADVAAHSELLEAVPTPGTTLSTPPAEIRLTFSAPLAAGSTLELFGAGFRRVSGVVARIDPQNAQQLVAVPPALSPGTYTVQWSSVAEDGDTLSGSYTFTLLAAPGSDPFPLLYGVFGLGILALAMGALVWRLRRRPHDPVGFDTQR